MSNSQGSSPKLNGTRTFSPTIRSSRIDGNARFPANSFDNEEKSGLCKFCQQLDLSVDKFVIPDDATASPYNANKSVKSDTGAHTLGRTNPVIRSGGPPLKLGSLWDVQQRMHRCALCNLVAQSVEQHDLDGALQQHGPELQQQALCELSWEIDGREYLDISTGLIKNRTRRLRVQWSHPAMQQFGSYLVFVAPKQDWQPNSEAQSSSRRESHFLGRNIDPTKGRTALIKSWLDLCRFHHDEHCQDKYEGTEEFQKMLGESYFGVLDVVNMQLCTLPHKGRGSSFTYDPFVALSYVWGKPKPGKPKPYVTIRDNILLHQNHGGLQDAYSNFPKAIKEAIELVPRLGMRYIWIDSLCIVQDSFSSWNLNAQRMHMIYGFASLTICAADGEDSCTGLEALHADSAKQIQGTCAPGITLMVSRPPETAIRGSYWNQRAWTFQERLLSRWCIIFAEKRVYFQCRSASMSQDIFAHGRATAWSLDSIYAPLQMLKELRIRAIWFYIHCVSMYTSRHLTKPRDIPAAFNGVTTIIQQVIRAPFVFGLPSSHIDLALLWQPRGRIAPRVVKDEGDRAFEIDFHTWAWCGWIGSQVEYDPDQLVDCLANVHEWLVNHTWICYYIRDDQGNLRPLWDNTIAEEDQSSEARWRGYRGKQPVQSHMPVPIIIPSGSFGTPKHARRFRKDEKDLHANPDSDGVTGRIRRQSTMHPNNKYGDEDAYHETQQLAENLRQHHRLSQGPATLARDLKHFRANTDATARSRKMSMRPAVDPDDLEVPGNDISRSQHYKRERIPFSPVLSDDPDFHPTRQRVHHEYPDEDANNFEPNLEYEPTHEYGATIGQNQQYTIPLPHDVLASSPQEQRRLRYQINQNYREMPSQVFDIFGRATWPEMRTRPQNDFFKRIPENPFRVLKAPDGYSGKGDKDQMYQTKLQFWTWKTTLQVCRAESRGQVEGTGLCRCDIMDDLGDWCGTVVVNDDWINKAGTDQGDHTNVVTCEFIALSEAKSFTMEECPTWTYYIPKERHESEWDVFYVFLVKYQPKSAIWQRVALGKVFRAAFSFDDSGWQEIILG